jgi:putative ubiquitin-RnfH superfamily antitoxin RatB of RatAB toxin-antitoxin module
MSDTADDAAPVTGSIAVEVAYAEPDQQYLLPVRVPVGTTLIEAVHASGIVGVAGTSIMSLARGVFGEEKPDNYVLGDGDRVEFYRPLAADAMEQRRRRAARQSSQPRAHDSAD